MTAIFKSIAKSRANSIIEEAKLEAEVLKKNKILEAKEEGVAIKAEAEKVATQRLSKVQSTEAKLKQREMQINQQQPRATQTASNGDTLFPSFLSRASLEVSEPSVFFTM